METIRWGIAGPGNIANKFARAIKQVEGASLVAVAARSEEKGKAFAEKYGVGTVFGSYEEMAKSELVDAVYVATPHPFHMPVAEIFLNEKKHVLSEKPMCVNLAQAQRLKECAERNGVFLMEAMWTRFLPAVQEACALVEKGEIGQVMGLTADFCYASTPREEAKIYKNSMAGGSLLDVGVYGLHFASLFLGLHPTSIQSMAHIDYDVDCYTNVLLKYETGAVATISSAINLRKPDSAYIYGTEGYLFVPHFYGAQELFVHKQDETTHIVKPSIGEGFEEEIYEACSCIRAGKTQSDVLPLSTTLEIIGQMDQVRKQIGLVYPFDGE